MSDSPIGGRVPFRVGEWLVEPGTNSIRSGDASHQLEPKAMEVLCYLADRPNETVTRDAILASVWPDRVVVEDTLTRIISRLRTALGDDPDAQRYIQTVRKRGYRLVAQVDSAGTTDHTPRRPGIRVNRAVVVWVVAALASISLGTIWWQNLSSPEPAVDSIAVLPFENLADDPEGAYLSEGITVGLINSLSGLKGLKVASRGVAFAYGNRGLDLPTIANELGVRVIVTGRVTEVGERFVIQAELVDASRLEQLWGQQYDRRIDDVLAVQRELVGAIIDQLAVSLSSEEFSRVTDPATENPEAYRLYLRAKYHIFRVSEGGLDKGVRYAQAAIELDPGFALAHVALSQAEMTRAFLGLIPWEEGGRISRVAVQKALALDDSLPEVHVELGFLAHHFDWDWREAESEFRHAIALDAGQGEAWQGLAESLLSQVRIDAALDAATQAVERSPLEPNVINLLGFIQYNAHRYEESLATVRQALELEPNHILARSLLPRVLIRLGQRDEAVASAREAAEPLGENPGSSALLASILAEAGNAGEARQILDHAASTNDSADDARALMATGNADAAFAMLDRLLAVRSPDLLWFRTRPSNDVFKADSRYAGFLSRFDARAADWRTAETH